MKTYISGQITGLQYEEFVINFSNAKWKVWDLYKNEKSNIINPLDISPIFGIKKWLFYMVADLYQLKKCTHIAMQPNWIHSREALIEYFFAKFIFKQQIIWL